MAGPLALIGPALKMLASQGVKKAAMETAKGAAKNKAKDFVTGKGRKKKGKKGKGGALVKSEGGQEEGSQEGGGAIVATTPIVGSYRVETPPQKPDEEGKPSKVSYEAINNQLDSIVGLTEALKKTSMAKMKTATNRRKAERKAEEKDKQRSRESLLERGAVGAIGAVGGAVSKAAPFDPLKFFTMIFLGSLLLWIVNNGSKITAFLKITLALMNNFGKLVKAGFTALKNVFKVGFNAIKKLGGPLVKVGKALKNGIKSVGSGLSRAFGRIGNGIKNLAKGAINKIKAAGKILASPLKALQGLTGAEKKAVKSNSGLNKLVQNAGTGSQNLGTATRPPGTLSNATKSMRLKHGDEAARMYQGLIDNGMKPSKAAQYVNKSISSGKLTSAPLEGTLAGGKKGSQLLKGGVGRSTNRIITKLGGKNALKATKALKKALGRIPIVGGLITLVVSLLGGDPVSQALFKTGGAVLGGFLGSFIPIPVVGTLFGEIVGEYVGDLMYVATMGGGVEAVGQKLKDDLTAALSVGQKAMDWVGNGFGRMYEGIPKINVPFINKKFPDPRWMLSLVNIPEKLGIFHKAFFTDKPMEKGEEKTEETQETSGNVTNVSTVRRDTKGARAGDFIMASDGTLGVFDGMGTRGLRAGEQELYNSGATNIDGTKPVTTTTPSTAPRTGSVDVQANIQAILKAGKDMNYTGDMAALLAIAKGESGIKGIPEQPITSAQRASEVWPPPAGFTVAEAQSLLDQGGWRALYNEAYGWRGNSLGNRPGTNDGSDFIGRGFIQITGRHNYKDIGNRIGVDFMKNPELLLDRDIAARATIAFMQRAGSPKDMESSLRAVGGIKEGWPKKRRFYEDFRKQIDSGQLKLSAIAPETPNIQPQTPKVDLPETYTTAGVTYDLATGLPVSGTETQVTRQATPDNSDKMSDQNQSDSVATPTPTPAQITPPSQSSLGSGISGISRQLPYEQVGGTTILMAPGSSRGGGTMVGRTSAGTPVIVGSGDVVNSYYKSQLLGFLYKQG